jgi:alanine racemase
MSQPTRPTYLEVNLAQLKRNLDLIRARVAPALVMPMVKANAYGHGIEGVAPFIAPFADYLGVATVEEGVQLREMGIDKPILVTGGTLPNQLPFFSDFNLTLTASSSDLLRAARELAESTGKRLTVHLKIDTGMERVGVRDTEAEPFLEESLRCASLNIEGIYSHFANSDAADLTHARLQLERFHEVLRFYEKRSLPPPRYRHIANSGAVLQLPESYLDMVRVGVLFYGVFPTREAARTLPVQPALTWRSRVVYSKVTPPGRPVSYGSLWQAERPTRIVTVPCGYADGYFRNLTNRAQVIVNGKRCPQVGRVCMDQFMADVGDDPAQVGDPVVLLGGGIGMDEYSAWAGTNNYEILTGIGARVPRAFVVE